MMLAQVQLDKRLADSKPSQTEAEAILVGALKPVNMDGMEKLSGKEEGKVG